MNRNIYLFLRKSQKFGLDKMVRGGGIMLAGVDNR